METCPKTEGKEVRAAGELWKMNSIFFTYRRTRSEPKCTVIYSAGNVRVMSEKLWKLLNFRTLQLQVKRGDMYS